MKIKPGVDVAGMTPEILLGLQVAERVYLRHGYGELRLTSCREGKHRTGSLHYVGLAADVGVIEVEVGQRQELGSLLRDALGPQYDVVVEKDHIHLEFQPK